MEKRTLTYRYDLVQTIGYETFKAMFTQEGTTVIIEYPGQGVNVFFQWGAFKQKYFRDYGDTSNNNPIKTASRI